MEGLNWNLAPVLGCILLQLLLGGCQPPGDDDDSAEDPLTGLPFPFFDDFEGSSWSEFWTRRGMGITLEQAYAGTYSCASCNSLEEDDCRSSGLRPSTESYLWGTRHPERFATTELPLDLSSVGEAQIRFYYYMPYVAQLNQSDEVEDPGSPCPVVEGLVGVEGEPMFLLELCAASDQWRLAEASLAPLIGEPEVFLRFRVPEYWTGFMGEPTRWFFDDVTVE